MGKNEQDLFFLNKVDIMNKLKMFKAKKFHFIGIGGVSMSSLALVLKHDGFYVQGSNEVINDELKLLAKKKIRIFIGHSKNNVLGADVVVYSSAIHEDNPELKYAREHNLIVLKRAELLGMIAENYKTVIAIAGSHGKTTATAMISEIFLNAGLKPTIHAGGKLKAINSNYLIGNKKFFITENCEYKDNFLFVKPDISVILNIDSDHLDYFGNLNGVKKSFLKYANGTKQGGVNIVLGEDVNSFEIKQFENSASFGLGDKNDIYAKNIKEYKAGFYSFDVVFNDVKLGNIKLNIVGEHNVLNALASILVALICDIDFEIIKTSLEKFMGVKRRCELIGYLNGAAVYHDYAHHPKQIEKMIKTAKELVKNNKGRIITIFEPHTFSRTKYLLEDFAKSFVGSDYVIFAPVYSARELESEGLNSIDLMTETRKYICDVEYLKSYNEIVNFVKGKTKKDDLVLVLGAGTIEKLAKDLVK